MARGAKSTSARPRSEAPTSHEEPSRAEVTAKSNGNPFQEDNGPVWADGSTVSSPECTAGYQYEYQRVADTPATPELHMLRSNGHLTGDYSIRCLPLLFLLFFLLLVRVLDLVRILILLLLLLPQV